MRTDRRDLLRYLAAGGAVAVTGCLWGDDEPENGDENGDDDEISEETDIFDDEEGFEGGDEEHDVDLPDEEGDEEEIPEVSPDTVVRDYYEAIHVRDFERASNLIHPEGSTEYGKEVTPADIPTNLTEVRVTETEVVEREGTSAVVRFVLETTGEIGDNEIEEVFEGVMGVQVHEGEWKIVEEETVLVDTPTGAV